FNDYINSWRSKLFQTESYELPLNSGTGFVFKVTKNPIFTNISDLNYLFPKRHNIPPNMLKLKGVQFKEISLLFSTKHGGKTAKDIHPMRGLVNYSPFDKGLSNLQNSTINLSIICPQEDSDKLYNFLIKQNQEIRNPN